MNCTTTPTQPTDPAQLGHAHVLIGQVGIQQLLQDRTQLKSLTVRILALLMGATSTPHEIVANLGLSPELRAELEGEIERYQADQRKERS